MRKDVRGRRNERTVGSSTNPVVSGFVWSHPPHRRFRSGESLCAGVPSPTCPHEATSRRATSGRVTSGRVTSGRATRRPVPAGGPKRFARRNLPRRARPGSGTVLLGGWWSLHPSRSGEAGEVRRTTGPGRTRQRDGDPPQDETTGAKSVPGSTRLYQRKLAPARRRSPGGTSSRLCGVFTLTHVLRQTQRA
jgi:hypothetical protein